MAMLLGRFLPEGLRHDDEAWAALLYLALVGENLRLGMEKWLQVKLG